MTEKIVLTITKHPLWGYILQPVLVEENEYGKMAILEYADSQSSSFHLLDDLSKEIILLSEKMSDITIMECFSKEKEKTIAAFHKKIKQETIEFSILPYIEDTQSRILTILKKTELPLYFRENVKIRNLYETNQVVVPNDYSKAIFNFKKEDKDSGIQYSIHVIWQDEELDIFSQTYIPLCSKPAALVVNKRLLLFNDIDIKKLIPFFSRREIEIPISYESTYIKTFIKNCMENHEVITKGIDVSEITPHQKA
ncbi:MAG: hypothetical protein PHR38_07905 [Bacteroidales bacterium]|nr:hypothetical protein [Bacteroidales bacterium]MDD3906921.1 hypothetical protein [Bacteroidales bacterium]MDD4713400.1 hypothetical protein [Bacteroidales bacterium]